MVWFSLFLRVGFPLYNGCCVFSGQIWNIHFLIVGSSLSSFQLTKIGSIERFSLHTKILFSLCWLSRLIFSILMKMLLFSFCHLSRFVTTIRTNKFVTVFHLSNVWISFYPTRLINFLKCSDELKMRPIWPMQQQCVDLWSSLVKVELLSLLVVHSPDWSDHNEVESKSYWFISWEFFRQWKLGYNARKAHFMISPRVVDWFHDHGSRTGRTSWSFLMFFTDLA